MAVGLAHVHLLGANVHVVVIPARDLQPVRNLRSLAVAAIDAPLSFLLSFQLFEGEKSFESPVVHLTAGGCSV